MHETDLAAGAAARLTRRAFVAATGASAAVLAAPTLAGAAKPVSPLAERIAKNEGITVDPKVWKKSPPYTIALVTQGPFNGWGKMYNVAAQYAADRSGKVKKTLVFDSFGDPTKQINAISDLLAQKPDAILLTPMSKAALSAPVARAMRSGIPVVLCGSGVDTNDYVAEVGRNLYLLAYDNALAFARRLGGRGRVVMFNGIAGTDTAETWRQAAKDAFSQFKGIDLVADEFANWSVADAKKSASAILQANSKIDGIWTGGSEMAIGTILAYADAKRRPPQIGTTNPLNGFLRLARQHKLKFVASPYPPAMSYYGMQTTLDVLAGKRVKKYQDVKRVMLKGKVVYTERDLARFYDPRWNDDYIAPTPVPAPLLRKAGFGRK